MRVRDVRSWQWMIAGLLCGLAVGVARVGWGPGYQDEVSRTLPQPLFEHGVTSSSGSAFHLSELLIHPPDGDGATWVTGQLREQSQDEHGSPTIRAEPFKFRATVPYRPGVALDFAGSPSEVTVEDYLAQIASRVPQAQVRFRYAWEERPAPAIWICAAIGMVVIGVAWPAALRRLAGPPIDGIDFSQLSRTETVTRQGPGSDRHGDALDSINRRMEVDLTAIEVDTPHGNADTPPASPLRPLEVTPIDCTPVAAAQSKAFEGEYYPTEAHARKSE